MARLAATLGPAGRRAAGAMALVVIGLHAAGFLVLFAVIGPHAGAGRAGGLLVGTGLTAYTLGLRHAFDPDHIAAIDNTTRSLMADGRRRPISVGFWFSLGHSSVVFVLAVVLALGARALSGQVTHPGSSLHTVTGWIGTSVSGTFLYLIAGLNLVILAGIVRVIGEMRGGRYDEAALERQLLARGLMNRLFGRFARAVRAPRDMYGVGVLFGLGFDTASEVALLLLAAGAAGAHLPVLAVLCLPVLFAAGMSLLDTLDGAFMSLAYGWAFTTPLRRVFYNLVITGLSVAVAALIATVEIGGLLAERLGARGAFWGWLEHIDMGELGYVIAGLFVLTWALAVLVWRVGRVEERWGALLAGPDS